MKTIVVKNISKDIILTQIVNEDTIDSILSTWESSKQWGAPGTFSVQVRDLNSEEQTEFDNQTSISSYRHDLKNIAQSLNEDASCEIVKDTLFKLIKLLILNDGLK